MSELIVINGRCSLQYLTVSKVVGGNDVSYDVDLLIVLSCSLQHALQPDELISMVCLIENCIQVGSVAVDAVERDQSNAYFDRKVNRRELEQRVLS